MTFLNWQRKAAEDGQEGFTLPDDLQKKIDDGAAASAELPKIREMLEELKNIQVTASAEQKKKDDAAAARAAVSSRQEAEGTLEEQIEALMLEGKTKQALALANQPVTNEVLLLRADRVKREVFEDEQKFKYYHGDIKREVDALIAAQSIQAKNDASVVENCYKTVLGNHTDELLEGKIKSRFASSDNGSRGTSGGSAGDTGSGTHERKTPTDEVRKAAKLLGFTAEDYAEMLDKEGVGY
jgi:hypothetical protein